MTIPSHTCFQWKFEFLFRPISEVSTKYAELHSVNPHNVNGQQIKSLKISN